MREPNGRFWRLVSTAVGLIVLASAVRFAVVELGDEETLQRVRNIMELIPAAP